MKNGLPYIGYSYSAASSASDLIAGVEYTELDGATGTLKLDGFGNVLRTPAWSTFSSGVVAPIRGGG